MSRLNRTLLSLIPTLAALPALADGTPGDGGYWHGMGWGWGGMLFGSITMLLFWGGLIVLIVLAVRWLSGGVPGAGTPPAAGNRAREILEERFAHGEIDKEEFEERKRLLSK